ncbi:MAG: F0F1 ATP synthase subunit delta [Burkholderiales bacterium]|nr:F0F1 ATP synthase subunit delta [Burkholderiales bacterium]
MAELATIARPYAEAVFDVAAAASDYGRWSGLLGEMAAIAANEDLGTAIADPRLTEAQRVDLFVSLVRSPLDEPARNFVAVLAQNDRLAILPEVSAQFEALRAAREGVADAEIESAFPMSDADLAKLTSILEKRFGRKIRPHVKVVPELIGGVRVAVGDEVIDGSVRGKLAEMEAALKS